MRVTFLDPAGAMPPFTAGAVPLVDPLELQQHQPDQHLVVAEGNRVEARCSLWWTAAPPLAGHRVGIIGHYAAGGERPARQLLDGAAARLTEVGCTMAIGPMDGNTWRRYRFIVERGSEPAFFLEPDNDDRWPAQWHDAGFRTFATYTSSLAGQLAVDEVRLRETLDRLSNRGMAIRPFEPRRAEEELRHIYRLSLEGFRRNLMYAPLGEDEFLEQNRRLLPVVRPELVLMAERAGEIVGYLLTVPDALEFRRTGSTRTIVLKTIAVAPGVARAGLGSALIARALQAARGLGFSRAIFALMHEDNVSQRISRHYGTTTMRRYGLFGRLLASRASEPPPGTTGAGGAGGLP